jgi:5-methylcytosine-specific restriction enzyme A
MSELSNLKPTKMCNIMDLVRDAGVDVSDWANFKGGERKAASNPNYCNNWSFVDEPKKVIVLILWYNKMQEQDGAIFRDINYRDMAQQQLKNANRKKHARQADRAIQTAWREGLPIRVIVSNEKGDPDDPKSKKRLLDPVAWTVTSYDDNTRECRLTRGVPDRAEMERKFNASVKRALADPPTTRQSRLQNAAKMPVTCQVVTEVYLRNPDVVAEVLYRAAGLCELCNKPAPFARKKGRHALP